MKTKVTEAAKPTRTQGPWTVENETRNGGATVNCPDYEIAQVSTIEDARLIAASPDLLAALIRIRNAYAVEPRAAVDALAKWSELGQQVDAVLLKVEGGK